MIRSLLVATVFWTVALLNSSAGEIPENAAWDAVREALEASLPKTAIKELQPIAESARQRGENDQWILASVMQITLSSQIGEPSDASHLRSLQSLVDAAPDAAKPILLAIRADWLLRYFQANRWQLANRTAGGEGDVSDDEFETWSLPTIIAEVDRAYTDALANEVVLQNEFIDQYQDLIDGTDREDSLPTPTWYDFIVGRAIEFYSSPDYDVAVPMPAYKIGSDEPALADVETFVNWQVDSGANDGVTRTLRLYQAWLKSQISRDPKNLDSMIATDLARLKFVSEHMAGESVAVRYTESLQRLAQQYRGDDTAAIVLDTLARQNSDRVESLRIAREAMQKYPGSLGANNAASHAAWITGPELRMTSDSVWIRGENEAKLQYRNLDKVFFRIVEYREGDSDKLNLRRAEQAVKELLDRPSVKNFQAKLPSTDDYQSKQHWVEMPSDLKLGRYWLVASQRESFDGPTDDIMRHAFTRSDLAAVTRTRYSSSDIEGIITDNRDGHPIQDARIIAQQQIRHNKWQDLPVVATDRDGRFVVRGRDQRQVRYEVVLGDDRLFAGDSFSFGRRQDQFKVQRSTVLITDRALYRPGQTIHFKGLVVSADQAESDYGVVADLRIHFVATDINGQQIGELKTTTNSMGSFHGSFEIPRGIPTGQVNLQILGEPNGYASVSVEEYKRPKFEVAIDSPQTAIIGQPIELTGTASSYTGFAVSGATVRYRITRQANFPRWCYWAPPSPPIEIDASTTVTDQDGKFTVKFTAIASTDLPANIPLSGTFYRYEVFADVVDATGEARSATSTVVAGQSDLRVEVAADRSSTTTEPLTFTVTTTTPGGDAKMVGGELKIYRLIEPEEIVSSPVANTYYRGQSGAGDARTRDWEVGEVVETIDFKTDGDGHFELSKQLPAGAFRAIAVAKDKFGNDVIGQDESLVVDPNSPNFSLKIDNVLVAPTSSVSPGQNISAVWGSGYDNAHAYIEVMKDDKVLQAFWSVDGRSQQRIEQAVDESMRGGFLIRTTMVHDGELFVIQRLIDVPWSNKKLTITAERLRSRLTPGEKEKIILRVAGPDAKNVAAEIAATMYDASLDSIRPLAWPTIEVFRSQRSDSVIQFSSSSEGKTGILTRQSSGKQWRPLRFVSGVSAPWNGRRGMQMMRSRGMPFGRGEVDSLDFKGSDESNEMPLMASAMSADAAGSPSVDSAMGDKFGGEVAATGLVAAVTPRTNLGESAFFLPVLRSAKDGTVTIEFTVPDALTRWRILAMAHDEKLRNGQLDVSTVTAKDLMVEPNPPRFVRAGDQITWTTKISNASATRQSGTSKIQFRNAFDDTDATDKLLVDQSQQSFDLAAGESTVLRWRLRVPEQIDALVYRVTAASERASDGQEDSLAVLPSRVAVRESIAMPIRGVGEKSFVFKPLTDSEGDDLVRHESLQLRVNSHPAWDAIFALPYLMQYPHQCAEQTFARYYANAVAQKIAQDNPKLRRVIDSWRQSGAIESPLLKDEDLKAIAIAETPWLAEGKSETQSRLRLAGLFEENRVADEMARAWRELNEFQSGDGSFPWFVGGRPNEYITLAIATGLGRMQRMGVEVDMTPAIKSWSYLDGVMHRWHNRENPSLNSTVAMYLYGRSFVGKELRVAPEHQAALEFWIQKATQDWKDLPLLSQGHLALAMNRTGHRDVATAIVKSIMEHSVVDQEMGLYWPNAGGRSWWWYQAPIETQAMMIEVLDEVAGDASAVEEAKVWLIKQKQTQAWPTTKSTTDAIYAILMRGNNPLTNTVVMTAIVGGQMIQPKKVEMGTGAYGATWSGEEILPVMGNITIRRESDGVGWASMNLLSMRQLSDIRAGEDKDLSIEKEIFVRRDTPQGKRLFPVDGLVRVGDELVSRLTIRCDRDAEFVHVRDHRGSGTEPVEVLSRYDVIDGLWIYQSTRDTATHYFIDSLPKGTYVVENTSRVQLEGNYTTGYALAECMYAPEFSSHSASILLEATSVKDPR